MEAEKEGRPAKTARSGNARRGGSPNKETAKAARRVVSLEKRVEKAEAELAKIEDRLADPAEWATPEKMAKNTRRHDKAKQKVADLYREWEAAEGVNSVA